ncbi:MAG TPA: hypothetical protein PK760_06095 [Flavobacteriales bacterium]|nr:hypothetical protein [Flavobacteriales bacterium]
MADDLGFHYLIACKSAYAAKHWPLHAREEAGLVVEQAGLELIRVRGPLAFSGFLNEYQYLVDLWTAHLLIEYFPSADAAPEACLKVIKRYSIGTLNEKLGMGEAAWLKANYP